MKTKLRELAGFYFNGRKISYYEDFIEELTFDKAFEEDEQKRDQLERRISNLQRRAHSILKPKSLLEKASYEFGRFAGN